MSAGVAIYSGIAGPPQISAPLGATPPTCLSTRSGHRDSPPAWRPPERAFPPTRPTSWTLPGVAIYGDLKVRAGGAPVGLGSSQGHGGSGWGVGCAWGSPLPAVVRVWAPGGAAGTWRRFPARPGAFSFPPSCPHLAPASRGGGRRSWAAPPVNEVDSPCLTFSQVQSARNRLVGSAADPGDEALFLKNGR